MFPRHGGHSDGGALAAFDIDEAFVEEIEVVDCGEGIGGGVFGGGEVGFGVGGCNYGEV